MGPAMSCLEGDPCGRDSTDETLLMDMFENKEFNDEAEDSAEMGCCPPPENAPLGLVGDSGISISVSSSSDSTIMTLRSACGVPDFVGVVKVLPFVVAFLNALSIAKLRLEGVPFEGGAFFE